MAKAAFSGANLPKISDYNLRLVLDQIRRARTGISRVEIANETGLTIQTVSNQVTKLFSLGLVEEGERLQSARGKPRTQLLVRDGGGYAIGVHVDPSQVSFVLTDMKLNPVKESRFAMPSSVEEFLKLLEGQVRDLSAGTPSSLIRGVGVAVPGPIDMNRGTVESPPHLPGWNSVPLRDMVAAVTGLDTFIQKDSMAALTGELWFRNRSVEGSTLYVYLGFGLGFAHAQRGEVYFGTSGNAGELGHLRTGEVGPMCWCGKRGCLGAIVSPETTVDAAIELGLLPESTAHTPSSLADSMKELGARAAEGDARVDQLLRGVGEELAKGMLVFSDFVDASSIVVGGHQQEVLWPYLEEAFAAEHERVGACKDVHSVSLARADFGDWGAAIGAASIVMDSAFSPQTSILFSPGDDGAASVSLPVVPRLSE